MICPACQNPMVVIEYKKIELDYCLNCQGVWFDCGELELLLKAQSTGELCLPEGGIVRSSNVKTSEKKRKCPICGRRMNKDFIAEKSEILIDACPQGEGLFFDGGEVEALLKQMTGDEGSKSGEVISFIRDVFQKPA